MAFTTVADIVARFRAVLEADPFYLRPSKDQFSHTRTPNVAVDDAYYILDDGLLVDRPLSNYAAARLDRVTVFVAHTLKFDPVTEVAALEDTLRDIERYIKADGPDHDYRAELALRRVSRPENGNVAVGSLGFNVDYDYDESVQ